MFIPSSFRSIISILYYCWFYNVSVYIARCSAVDWFVMALSIHMIMQKYGNDAEPLIFCIYMFNGAQFLVEAEEENKSIKSHWTCLKHDSIVFASCRLNCMPNTSVSISLSRREKNDCEKYANNPLFSLG